MVIYPMTQNITVKMEKLLWTIFLMSQAHGHSDVRICVNGNALAQYACVETVSESM
jgi:hypothetical protein